MYGLPPTTAAYSVTGHAELFPGRIVRKSYTRSSDKLQAKVNGVLMDTNITSALLKTPSEIITQEWVVIGDKREPVSWPGDSGGLFLDATGNLVVGMIIGGVSDKTLDDIMYDNITLITPAKRLIDWIRQDFGREVTFGVGGCRYR